MYEFFRGLIPFQETSKSEFNGWRNQVSAINKDVAEWNRWNDQQANEYQSRFGKPQPEQPTYLAPKRTHIVIDSNETSLRNLDIRTSWIYIHEEVRAGKGKENAKKGDIWFETKQSVPLLNPVQRYDEDLRVVRTPLDSANSFGNLDTVYLYWQEDNLKYRMLEIVGLEQHNYVYNNKAVYQSAFDALKEGDESSFLVPMHYPTISKLNLIEKNQLATCNKLLVFNSYQIVKRRWYQRGIFKVVFAIAVVLVMVIINPLSLAFAPGVLGMNVVVGVTLGFAGIQAIIAGAIANAIAAIILATVITKASVSIFGEKWGAIIATVVTYISMQAGYNFATTGNIAVNWDKLLKPENLLQITDSVGKLYQGYVQGTILEMQEAFKAMQEEYNTELNEIEKLFAELSGNQANIDPMMFTSAGKQIWAETSETFLSRTLLTGSDIAEISNGVISDYVDMALRLPDPLK